jgi:hypothetical protein
MSCEKYQAAISEAAAALEASAMLEAHLAGCVSCRARYAKERDLFAAIDAGLSRVANAQLRPSFLPRVGAALEQEAAARGESRSWFLLGPVVALAVGVCLAFAVFERVHSRPETDREQASVTAGTSGIAKVPEVLPQRTARPVTRSQRTIHRAARADDRPRKPHEPEVIVPPDERIAFAKFVSGLSQPNQVAIALRQAAPVISSALEAEPLEIAELRIEPLAPNEAQ